MIADLEEQFTEKQKTVEEELRQCEEENQRLKQELRTHHSELELWYPSFPMYQDSYLKTHIPHYSHHGQHARGAVSEQTSVDAEEVPAEVRIAEDFKRLLAVLAPEKRQAIGQELAPVLKTDAIATNREKDGKKGGKRERLSMIVAEGQRNAERESQLTALQEEVAAQEMKIQDLKDTIKTLERQEAEGSKLIEATSAPTGQDSDGLDLNQRRATAAPMQLMAASNVGKRAGRGLMVPTPEVSG